MLALMGHAVGWPVPRGGSQSIADALAGLLRRHGGTIVTRSPVRSLDPFADARAVLLDVTPRQVLAIAGERLPRRYRRQLAAYRYAPGVFKIDWALAEPIPWTAPECRQAGTVHLGSSMEEIAAAERAYDDADRDDAEERYGEYVDLVEEGTETLADIRDSFKRTLDEDTAEQYEAAFNRAVKKRLPRFGLEIDLR
jgi:hypothetical protein